MIGALERMNAMITRILDVRAVESKKIELNLKRVNLLEILKGVIGDFKGKAHQKKIKINFKAESNGPYAEIDENYTTQIYENLISNAIKFSPPRREICIKLWQREGKILTAIKDQGPGISADDFKKLFGKYQKLSAKPTAGEPTTGLGLSIVKKYVEAMEGEVWCESEQGHGATFMVSFKKPGVHKVV